jgi:hypothetical protein
MTSYRFRMTVDKVEHKHSTIRTYKHKDMVHSDKESLGWFVLFQGVPMSLHFGNDKPDLFAGQCVTLLVQPDVSDAA